MIAYKKTLAQISEHEGGKILNTDKDINEEDDLLEDEESEISL